MAQENIKLTKTIYSTKSTDGLVDRSFSEVFKTKDPVNLDRFFSMYGELFYDIPKTGNKSHRSIIKQSQEYIGNYIDGRDETINTLTERIIELEEKLNAPKEEHPFYTNGTLIATDNNNNGTIDGGVVYYMDRGKRRYIKDKVDGDVFKALKSALGFPNDAEPYDIVKIIPQIVFENIEKGTILDMLDLSGVANNIEAEEQLISEVGLVDNWRIELRDIINPVESNLIADRIVYTNQVKQKIISEFERESKLESLSYKYYLDVTQGYTQQERENGQILINQVNPQLRKSRQTLAVLKRIWDKRADFPNINFNEILPGTQASVNADGTINTDKGSGIQINQLTEEEVKDAFDGWDEGRNLFEGILDGADYTVSYNAEELEYKSVDARALLTQGFIRIEYDKFEKMDPDSDWIDENGDWNVKYFKKSFGSNHWVGDIDQNYFINEETGASDTYRYKFNRYIRVDY